jgi:hypothetical protein
MQAQMFVVVSLSFSFNKGITSEKTRDTRCRCHGMHLDHGMCEKKTMLVGHVMNISLSARTQVVGCVYENIVLCIMCRIAWVVSEKCSTM